MLRHPAIKFEARLAATARLGSAYGATLLAPEPAPLVDAFEHAFISALWPHLIEAPNPDRGPTAA